MMFGMISSGRHETIHWDCVETEKVRIERALPKLPGTWYFTILPVYCLVPLCFLGYQQVAVILLTVNKNFNTMYGIIISNFFISAQIPQLAGLPAGTRCVYLCTPMIYTHDKIIIPPLNKKSAYVKDRCNLRIAK